MIIEEKQSFIYTSVKNFDIDIDTATLMFVGLKRRMLALLLLNNYFVFQTTINHYNGRN